MTSQEFGKYRLIERIAVGGTAEVFRAAMVWPDGREDPVVLKKILPQHARDKYFRQLFREEALVVASLQHANIVQIRDFGRLQGTFFLALEHVDGADLDTLIGAKEGSAALDGAIATYITSKICSALEYIHTRKSSEQTPLRIVHRDVSPHNILVSRQGEVKLADFGIAKSIIRDDRTTEGTIKGKFDYMSPEQATPGEAVDARTDLFSLGAVLYQLLLGAPPFRGRNDVETLERVRRCDYELDEERLPTPHRPLAAVMRRCLLHDREERYPDAAAMGRDLDAHLARLEAPVEPADLAAWAERAIRRAADSGSMNQLVSEMLGAEPRAGGTAMVSAQEPRGAIVQATPLDPAREVVPDGAGAPSRTRLVALIVAVAGLTAVITLVASGFFSRPAQRTVTSPDRADAAAAAGSPPDAAAVAALPPDAAAPVAAARVAAARIVDAMLPRRPRRPTPRRRPRRKAGRGRLTINSIPWARVFLDGRLLGTTPLRAVQVPAGLRRVVLKDGAGRVLRTFVARIPRGQTRTFSFDAKHP